MRKKTSWRLRALLKARATVVHKKVLAALTHRDSDRLLNTGNWIEQYRVFPCLKASAGASPFTIRPLR